MKRSSLLIVAVAMTTLFVSCKKESNTPSNSATKTDIPYLKVGNKWVYDASGPLVSFSTYTVEITGNNNGVYTLGTKADDVAGDNAYQYAENGYLSTFDQGESKGADQFLLKYTNPQVGDKWTRITPTETYYHELIATNVSVTVPAGTFICKQVKTTFKNAFNDQTDYWSDQYGQIKIDNAFLTLELKSKNF